MARFVEHSGGCIATDRITVDGMPVGYMYREIANNSADTGWRFFAGDEDDSYMDEVSNHGVFLVNTIANYSPEILMYLDTNEPCAFERIDDSKRFRRIE